MIADWNQIGSQWATIATQLLWQGSIAITIIWAITKAWPTMPASKRHWLWRLVYLKLLALVVWQTPIALPVLPPSSNSVAGAAFPSTVAPSNQTDVEPAWTSMIPLPPSKAGHSEEAKVSSAFTPSATNDSEQEPVNLATWLGLIWLLGTIYCLLKSMAAFKATRRLIRESTTLSGTPVYDLFLDLCHTVSLRQSPRLLTHPEIRSPLVVGCIQPCIIIPTDQTSDIVSPDTKLVLLHELSHIARKDLWWGWLRVTVESITFFHPLIWIARHQWNLSQEMACDESVLTRAQVAAPDYQQALLRTIEQGKSKHRFSTNFLAVGASGSFRDMKERLIAMNKIKHRSRIYQLAVASMVTVIGLIGVLPYQLVAGTSKDKSEHHSDDSIFGDRHADTHSTTNSKSKSKEKPSAPAHAREGLDSSSDWAAPSEDSHSEPVLSPVIQGLKAALASRQSGVRKSVVEALAELKDPAAIPVLITALQDSSSSVRHEALHGLEQLKDSRALDAVTHLLESDSWKVRNQAIDALEDFAHPDAAHSLLKALNDPHPKNRIKALDALEDQHHLDAVDAFSKSLHDEHWEVRKEAADVLGERRSPESFKALFQALGDDHHAVRSEAFDAIEDLDLPNMHDFIGELVKEHPQQFARQAEHFFEKHAEQQRRKDERKHREIEREAKRNYEEARHQAERHEKSKNDFFGFSDQHNKQSFEAPIHDETVQTIVDSVLTQVNAKVEAAVAKAISEINKKQQKQEKSGFDPFKDKAADSDSLF